jgi:hypothetical protein
MFTITWKRLAAASGVTAFVVLGSVGTAMIDTSDSSSIQSVAATATGTNIHKPTAIPPGYGPSNHPGPSQAPGPPPCQQRRC